MMTPAQPTTLDRLAARPRRTATLSFALDPNEGAAYREARTGLLVARAVFEQMSAPGAATSPLALAHAQRALDAAQAELDALGDVTTFTVHLRALEPERLDELVAEHPPTSESVAAARARGGDRPNVNAATYLPALLVEAITAIELSDDPDNALRGTLTLEQVETILAACPPADRALLGATAEALVKSASQVGV